MSELKRSLQNHITQLGAIVLAAISAFAPGMPEWSPTVAVAVTIIAGLSLLLAEIAHIKSWFRARFNPPKLTNNQALQLRSFLNEASNILSDSCIYSPFYVAQRACRQPVPFTALDPLHVQAIRAWVFSLKDKIEHEKIKPILIVDSLSIAISELTKAAERAEHDVQSIVDSRETSEQDRKRLQKEWDTSKHHFNSWISQFRSLFKEINLETNAGCVEYFRALELI
ncbi:hypothetical protein [Marinobacter bohaiensis]|uniref:hypothetical protein n=1 Tax=Marinobacter bohaiensis TaxID=2201898 RepID=UPI0013A6B4DB|nr:hypothetical protein [Marinobacter bohaiensis]